MPQLSEKTTLGAVMTGMKPGEGREGFVGKPTHLITRAEPEKLDAKDEARRVLYGTFLKRWIQPNKIDSKSTLIQDNASLVKKMDKSTLVDLKRLVPSQVKRLSDAKLQGLIDAETIEIGIITEIQSLYKDISP